MTRFRHSYFVLWLIIGILLVDFISKYLTQIYLPPMRWNDIAYPYGGIGIFKNFLGIEFSIVHTTNKGAAWGIFSNWQNGLLYVRFFLIIFLIIYALYYNKKKAWEIPLAFIIAGALGNVVDYFVYGHVIDMFRFVFWSYEYPVFNIADVSIFFGVFWLIILSWREKS